ncbi:MAG: hypothetical protein HW421_3123 [Ignavibacteria bacterium]|nr:hypothetical protein [Ignavibacteria bacterium]
MKNIYILLFINFLININAFAQWQRCDKGLPNNETIVTIASNKNIIAASCTDGYLYLSTNNGDNWNRTNYQSPSDLINSILILDKYIFFSEAFGLYKSTDSCKTYVNILDKISEYCFTCQMYFYNGNIYVGAWTKLYKSSDFGLSWSSIKEIDVKKMLNIDSIFLIATHNRGLIYSTNGCKSLIWFNNGLPSEGRIEISHLLPLGNNFLIKNVGNLFLSNDSLTKWNLIYNETYLWPLETCGKTIFAGIRNTKDSGIVYTTDLGKSWKQFNYGIEKFLRLSTYPFNILYKSDDYMFLTTKSVSYGILYRARIKDCQFDTTGINAIVEEKPPPTQPFSISPNPAGESITIRHGLQSGVIAIYNLLGEKIYESKIEGENPLNIDVSLWRSGVYLCVVRGTGGTITEKVVIAR